MTSKKFLSRLSNGEIDIVEILIDHLHSQNISYCVIGGLAVNAYADPVASLDLDIVLAIDDVEKLLSIISVPEGNFKVEKYQHSINLNHPDSDLRIQIQTDKRYQSFIKNAILKNVLGYEMMVANLEDLLMGKIWAYSDEDRRKSKRQKDLADIMRLVENHPGLTKLLPEKIKKLVD
jgi:hypothetical protein